MSLVPGLLWFALGTVAALLIYDLLLMPGIRRRAREEAVGAIQRERLRLELDARRLADDRARLEADLRRLEAGRAAAPAEAAAPAPAAPAAGAILLVLVRHGEAGTAGTDDARELTQAGRRDVRMLSADLQSRTFSPVAVRTSPLRRAHQTAETIFSALPDPGPVLDTAALAPGGGVAAMRALLRSEKPGSAVCWVGHMPDVGKFAAYLLGRDGDVAFVPGAAMALRVDPAADPPAASVEWAWAP